MKVAVLMGGKSAEREVSLHSGRAVASALRSASVDVFDCIYDGDIGEYIAQLATADVVFMALHGGEGENGEVQQVFDEEGLVYTGSGPEASALAMDKNTSKQLMVENELPTPEWLFFENDDWANIDSKSDLVYPLIVKLFQLFIIWLGWLEERT